jgi:hypothetical protein
MADVEVTGLRELIRDLEVAQLGALPGVRGVVQKGSLNIKEDWRQRWSGIGHAPALPAAITYDTRELSQQVIGEIGPDKSKRQGPLGNLIEFGSVNNPPIPGGLPALQTEEPKFLKALEDLAVKAFD